VCYVSAVRIPVWLTLGLAVLVILFGAYRLKLAFIVSSAKLDAEAKPRGGFYSMSKRTHVLVGIVYLLLGAGLMATSFGWNPWHDSAEPATKKPSGLPVDKLPKH